MGGLLTWEAAHAGDIAGQEESDAVARQLRLHDGCSLDVLLPQDRRAVADHRGLRAKACHALRHLHACNATCGLSNSLMTFVVVFHKPKSRPKQVSIMTFQPAVCTCHSDAVAPSLERKTLRRVFSAPLSKWPFVQVEVHACTAWPPGIADGPSESPAHDRIASRLAGSIRRSPWMPGLPAGGALEANDFHSYLSVDTTHRLALSR